MKHPKYDDDWAKWTAHQAMLYPRFKRAAWRWWLWCWSREWFAMLFFLVVTVGLVTTCAAVL